MSHQASNSRKEKGIEAVNYKTKIGDVVIILSDKVGGQNNRNSRKHDAVLVRLRESGRFSLMDMFLYVAIYHAVFLLFCLINNIINYYFLPTTSF